MAYLYRDRTLLVRDADVDRVAAIVSGAPVAHDNNLRGLTRLEFSADESRSVEEACADVDRALGEGVATPDHLFYVCYRRHLSGHRAGGGPGRRAARPGGVHRAVRRRGSPDGGSGQRLAAGRGHRAHWLAGVDGEPEDPFGGNPPRILPYAGHGTFVAGVVRAMAPSAEVWVHRTFAKFGAVFEADLVKQIVAALGRGAEIISLTFGTNTRNDIPLLGFEIVEERLRNQAGSSLVAAAGNDSIRNPFWPAAFPWAVGVGSLSANRRSRASFSNYGPWVDVFAPGEGLVNAFARASTYAPSHRTPASCGTSPAWPAGAGRPSRRRSSRGSSRPACRRPARPVRRPRRRCWPRPGPGHPRRGPGDLPGAGLLIPRRLRS